jgi:dipeptidase E
MQRPPRVWAWIRRQQSGSQRSPAADEFVTSQPSGVIEVLPRIFRPPYGKGQSVKLLLTSGGISNVSIEAALVDLLGKPIAASTALFVPTAIYPFAGGAGRASQALFGTARSPLTQLGWASLGLLELTALPTIKEEVWIPQLQATDALLVWGGDVLYLYHLMLRSGLAALLPSLPNLVYVGVSAGSIVMTPYNHDADFDRGNVPEGDTRGQQEGDRALGLVDFTLVPHLEHEDFLPEYSLASIEEWAATVPVPTYAIDDQTAIKVVDGVVEVVSEGKWALFGER